MRNQIARMSAQNSAGLKKLEADNVSNLVTPKNAPITVANKIPYNKAPRILYINMTETAKSPIMVTMALGLVMFPMETSVAGLSMTMPEPCRPIKAIKSPIPAEMAFSNQKVCSLE